MNQRLVLGTLYKQDGKVGKGTHKRYISKTGGVGKGHTGGI